VTDYVVFAVSVVVGSLLISYWWYRRFGQPKKPGGRRY
jgi:hypothetical protein